MRTQCLSLRRNSLLATSAWGLVIKKMHERVPKCFRNVAEVYRRCWWLYCETIGRTLIVTSLRRLVMSVGCLVYRLGSCREALRQLYEMIVFCLSRVR